MSIVQLGPGWCIPSRINRQLVISVMLSNLLRLGFPEVPNETLSGYKEILVTEYFFLPINQTGPPSSRRRWLILLITDRHKPDAYLWNAIRNHLLFGVSMLKMDFIWQVSISSSFKFSQNDNLNILIVLETLRSRMKTFPLVSHSLDESRKREQFA